MHTARRTELEKMRQQKNRRSLAFSVGGAALLVVGGTLAYWFLNNRQTSTSVPFGAALTPQNVLLSLTATSDDRPWQSLGKLGTPNIDSRWQDRLKAFERDFLTPFGLNYNQDIRSWVGPQVTLALLSPSPEDVARVGTTASIWFLPMRDAPKATAVLQRLTGSNAQTRTYKDVEVKTVQGNENKTLAFAVFENRLLVASNGNNTLNQVIDTYRGGPSLAQTPRLQSAMVNIQNSAAFVQLYVNLPIAMSGLLQDAGRSISATTVKRMQEVQGLGATVTLTDEGLKVKAISWLKPDAKTELKDRNLPQTLTRLLPADTLMAASGGSFQQAWQDYSQGTESQLVIPLNPSKIQSGLQKSTGLDFEKEFTTWMDGEFVVAVVPTANQAKQGMGLVLLAKATDRQKADQAFQKLDGVMRDRQNMLVAESKVGNRTITTWKVPPNFPLASHGWLDNNVAFFTFGAPVADRILTSGNPPLSENKLFHTTSQTSLTTYSGQFYADLPRIVALMQNSPLLPKLSPEASKLAQDIDGIGITAAIANTWSTRYDAVVKLKP